MAKTVKALIADETGTTASEYGFMAMLIAVAIVGVVTQLGTEVETQYDGVSTQYANANVASTSGG